MPFSGLLSVGMFPPSISSLLNGGGDGSCLPPGLLEALPGLHVEISLQNCGTRDRPQHSGELVLLAGAPLRLFPLLEEAVSAADLCQSGQSWCI